MIARASRLGLLIALVSMAPLGCGRSGGLKLDGAASKGDGAASNGDGTACKGAPSSCAGTDAGVDADATRDAPADGAACKGQPITCVAGGPLGTGVVCSDFGVFATCVGEQWMCPKDTIDVSTCTCGNLFPECASPMCTAKGWACPDAGTDADAHDSRTDQAGTDASCNVGCMRSTTPNPFCQAGEVLWECRGLVIDPAFRATCRDPGTHVPRFCCPSSFLSQCQ